MYFLLLIMYSISTYHSYLLHKLQVTGQLDLAQARYSPWHAEAPYWSQFGILSLHGPAVVVVVILGAPEIYLQRNVKIISFTYHLTLSITVWIGVFSAPCLCGRWNPWWSWKYMQRNVKMISFKCCLTLLITVWIGFFTWPCLCGRCNSW